MNKTSIPLFLEFELLRPFQYTNDNVEHSHHIILNTIK